MNPSTVRKKRPIRAVFMGTSEVACPSLRALIKDASIELAGVVTQPDRPQGRGQRRQPSPVRCTIENPSIPQWAPDRVNDPDTQEILRQAAPDVIVVMAYGQFLGDALLALPPLGCINVHLSLLPRNRGAAPIQWAIANGDKETGVTIMKMVRRMDAGDILDQEPIAIKPDDTAASLGTRLSEAAPPRLLHVLSQLAKGTATARPQNENQVTFAPLLKKRDGVVDWNLPAAIIEHRLRAFTPWPGCTTWYDGCQLHIHRATVEPAPAATPEQPIQPGTVLSVDGEGPLIAAGRDALRLIEVQPAGRRPMSGRAFICGHRLRAGNQMG